MEHKVAFLVDFDDTAAAQNVAEAVLERFAPPEWKGLREGFRLGTLSLREYQERAFNSVATPLQDMASEVAALVVLRPGLEKLMSLCESNDFQLAIVTNSLDFYVRAALQPTALRNTPIYAVGVYGKPGHLVFHYPYATDSCWEWGNCKCEVLERFRADGSTIVYIGDGLSDLCASQQADFVFARSTLLEHCRKLGLPHQEFTDFTDVVETLKRNASTGWLPQSSDTRLI